MSVAFSRPGETKRNFLIDPWPTPTCNLCLSNLRGVSEVSPEGLSNKMLLLLRQIVDQDSPNL